MDNLVTKTDMVGTLKLSLHDNVLTDFNSIVTEYQESYLKKLLGDYLYYTFINAIDSGTPAQKWLDLRDGANFNVTNLSETLILKWLGLKNMLKYFMFYFYSENSQSVNTVVGEAKKKNLNSNFSSPDMKMITAFNKGRDLYGINFSSLRNSLTYDPIYADCSYSEWLLNQDTNNRATKEQYQASKIIPSAYNFIYTKNSETADTYPNWRFTEIEHINTFNL
jgi:hypothetical protein